MKIPPPQAIKILDDCMNRGFETIAKIRQDFDANRQNPDIRKAQWDSWFHEWGKYSLQKLNEIYTEPNKICYFRDKVSKSFASTADTVITVYEDTIEVKIEVLKDYYDFIMNRTPNIAITNTGNLNFQVGENISNEQ